MRPRVQSPIPQEKNFKDESDWQYLEAVLILSYVLTVKIKSCLEQIALLSLLCGQGDACA